jgi:transposase
MYKKYVVALTKEQRQGLVKLVSNGMASARKLTRARILLMTDSERGKGQWTDDAISRALDVSTATIQRVRQQFVEEGLEAAIEHQQPQRSYQRKLDKEAEALLVVLFFSDPPSGRDRWTAKLLADKLIEIGYVDYISHKTINKTLRENGLNARI